VECFQLFTKLLCSDLQESSSREHKKFTNQNDGNVDVLPTNLDEQQNSPAFNLPNNNNISTPSNSVTQKMKASLLTGPSETIITGERPPQPPQQVLTEPILPEQYKNICFAKSIRERFSEKVNLFNNPVDFVDEILKKSHDENLFNQTTTKPALNDDGSRKTHRELTIQNFISHKKGLRVTCDICSETLADKKSMLRHKIIKHDKFSPHQCSVCHKTFYKPGDIRRHMFTHSDKRFFTCKYCGLPYKTNPNMRRHIRLKHQNQKKTVDINKSPTYLGLTQSISSHDDNSKGNKSPDHLVTHELQTSPEHHNQSSSSILGQSIKHSLNHPTSDEEILQGVPFLQNTDHFIGRPENIQIHGLIERGLF